MEENRLSSGISVEAVGESVEELLAHLAEQIKKTEALIRAHIEDSCAQTSSFDSA